MKDCSNGVDEEVRNILLYKILLKLFSYYFIVAYFFSIHAKQTNFDAQVKAHVSLITLCAMVLITATTDLIRV